MADSNWLGGVHEALHKSLSPKLNQIMAISTFAVIYYEKSSFIFHDINSKSDRLREFKVTLELPGQFGGHFHRHRKITRNFGGQALRL